MKRIALFALLAAFVLGSVATASAVDLKVRGDWRVHANWTDNLTFKDKNTNTATAGFGNNRTPEDDFNVYQRARVWFDFVANENLKGVLGIEIGDITWGNAGGGQLGADGTNLETKHAYLQFNIPNTKIAITAGIQPIALPSSFGSSILDDDMAGLVVSAPITDNFSTVFGYTRLFNRDGSSNQAGAVSGAKADDEVDAFFLVLPIKYEGYEVNPFFALAMIGKDFALENTTYAQGLNKSNIYGGSAANGGNPSFYAYLANEGATGNSFNNIDGTTAAYWFGLNAKVTALDPFVFMFDFNYGSVDWKNPTNPAGVVYNKAKAAGWFLDAAVDYKMSMMTPELFFFYSSGEDKKWDNGSERMPSVAPHFQATDILFDGSQFDVSGSYVRSNPFGLAALGLKLKDIKFIEKLTHTLTVAYIQGTNAQDSVKNYPTAIGTLVKPALGFYLTDKDSAWEVNVDSQYMLYDNLATVLELGYANVSLDKDTWGTAKDLVKSDAYRCAVGFRYKF